MHPTTWTFEAEDGVVAVLYIHREPVGLIDFSFHAAFYSSLSVYLQSYFIIQTINQNERLSINARDRIPTLYQRRVHRVFG